MRSLFLLFFMGFAVFLSACSPSDPPPPQVAMNFINRQHVTNIMHKHYAAKSPDRVIFYTSKSPQTPYRIIGVASVSRFNLIGKARADADVDKMMKRLAASIGGDALIHVTRNNQKIEGHVIQYQKILI